MGCKSIDVVCQRQGDGINFLMEHLLWLEYGEIVLWHAGTRLLYNKMQCFNFRRSFVVFKRTVVNKEDIFYARSRYAETYYFH